MGKSAQFPLHVWLPDAMEGPTPVSALIHAATMVTAGVYLLLRTEWLFALTPDVLLIVAWIGAFTALLAAVLACVQDDIKRVLAYSTVSQLGYMMTAIGAGFATAGFFHLLTHGVFKALLFLGAGAVIHAVHSNDLQHMGGLARRCRRRRSSSSSARCRWRASRSSAGSSRRKRSSAPCWAGGLVGPFALLMLVAFLTAFYMFRVVFLAFFGVRRAGAGAFSATPFARRRRRTRPLARPARSADQHGAAAVDPRAGVGRHRGVFHGRRPGAAVRSGRARVRRAWLADAGRGGRRRRRHPARVAHVSAADDQRRLAGRRVRSDSPRGASRSSGSTTCSRASTSACCSPSRASIGWIDRYIVDGVLNVVSAWTLTSGDDLRTMQTGRAQDYVYGVAVGLVVLLIWVRLG